MYPDPRLHVESIYRPAALPNWLHGPWQAARRKAADRECAPALVVNCKGEHIDDPVVVLRLADFEQLLGLHQEVSMKGNQE